MVTTFGSIFRYQELIEFEGDQLEFGKVDFLKDFGPFKKYYSAARIKIDLENMMMYELDETGRIIVGCKVVLHAE